MKYKSSSKLKIYLSKQGNHAQVTLIEQSINCCRLDVKQRLGRTKGKFKEKQEYKDKYCNKTFLKHIR